MDSPLLVFPWEFDALRPPKTLGGNFIPAGAQDTKNYVYSPREPCDFPSSRRRLPTISPTAVDPPSQCPASIGVEKTGICTTAARLRSSPGASPTIFAARNSPCEIRGLGGGVEALVGEDASLVDVAPHLPRAFSTDDQDGLYASIAPAASVFTTTDGNLELQLEGNENGEGADLLRTFEPSIRDAHVGIEEEFPAASSVQGMVTLEAHAAVDEAGAGSLSLAMEAAMSYVNLCVMELGGAW